MLSAVDRHTFHIPAAQPVRTLFRPTHPRQPRPSPHPPPAIAPTATVDDAPVRTSPRAAPAAFPLSSVRLLEGPFLADMRRTRAYLLFVDLDRLLHTFRLNIGLPSSAEPCGGWEAPTVMDKLWGRGAAAAGLSGCCGAVIRRGRSATAGRRWPCRWPRWGCSRPVHGGGVLAAPT